MLLPKTCIDQAKIQFYPSLRDTSSQTVAQQVIEKTLDDIYLLLMV